MALIQFTGLTKRYGNVTAVDDLTFTLTPGRVTGFVGANGAGKTHEHPSAARPDPSERRLGHDRRRALRGAR